MKKGFEFETENDSGFSLLIRCKIEKSAFEHKTDSSTSVFRGEQEEGGGGRGEDEK
jgi:hypothetical protein